MRFFYILRRNFVKIFVFRSGDDKIIKNTLLPTIGPRNVVRWSETPPRTPPKGGESGPPPEGGPFLLESLTEWTPGTPPPGGSPGGGLGGSKLPQKRVKNAPK
jgi:hypothetical protein